VERQPLLGTGEVDVDQVERLAELAAERVAVHERGASGRVAVLMVEAELEHALQVRPVLAVIGAQAGELSLDEADAWRGSIVSSREASEKRRAETTSSP